MVVQTRQVVASECCSGLFTANTRSGFVHCLEQKFDGVEFDVHLSKDGQVVVHHDYRLSPSIARHPGGDWIEDPGDPISQLTVSDLKQLEIGTYRPGSKLVQQYPECQPRDGEKIPTLEELLNIYTSVGSEATLWIELKTSPFQRSTSSDPVGLAQSVIDVATKAGIEESVVILAFEWQLFDTIKRQCPKMKTDFLTLNPDYIVALNRKLGAIDPSLLYGSYDPGQYPGGLPEAISAAGGDWWGPHIGDVEVADIELAHKFGLMVNLWGVDAGSDSLLICEADAITVSSPILWR